MDIVKESCKRENYESLKENIQKTKIKGSGEDEHTWREFPTNKDPRRHAPSRRPPMSRYQNFFYVLCYACNNYGHKAIDCRTYTRYINEWGKNRYENSKYQAEENYVRRSQLAPNRNYNRFGVLSYDIECYRCHNFGHIARAHKEHRLFRFCNFFPNRSGHI